MVLVERMCLHWLQSERGRGRGREREGERERERERAHVEVVLRNQCRKQMEFGSTVFCCTAIDLRE